MRRTLMALQLLLAAVSRIDRTEVDRPTFDEACVDQNEVLALQLLEVEQPTKPELMDQKSAFILPAAGNCACDELLMSDAAPDMRATKCNETSHENVPLSST
jgi:hypothetical protein